MNHREIIILARCKTCAHRIAERGEARNYRSLMHRGLIHRSTIDGRWRATPAGVKALAKSDSEVPV